MKSLAKSIVIYSILALFSGAFFREFTKFMGFDSFKERTMLSMVHPHYFMFGVIFLMILLILMKTFNGLEFKKSQTAFHIGLNISCIMMFVRGIIEVCGIETNPGINGAVSGIAGIGHIVIAVGIVSILVNVSKAMPVK